MCGIAGYYGRFEPSLLEAMTRLIAHRGPDDHGSYFSPDGRLGLGHRRLSIIDLAATGHQPMVSGDGRFCIIFNGEIYNYRELRKRLEGAGATFRGHSDTEVLLELFARDGIGCLRRVNGIFAFAVWEPAEHALTLVRDGLGVKPLYYAETDAGLLFASELKALLASRAVRRDYDRDAIAHYLTYLWAPSPETPLKSVRKLEPGEWVTIRQGSIVARGKYYQLPAPSSVERATSRTIEELDRELTAAVRRQLVADVPVGAFLSGGVDSSAVVALAKDAVDGPLECFTISLASTTSGADGMTLDLPYARRVAQHLGVPLHEVSVDDTSIADDLEWMVRQLDEPQADPACLNTYFISRQARARGFKVLLSGAGGDDLFSGYRRHLALQHERLWSWMPQGARGALAAGTQSLSRLGSRGRRVAKAFRYADRSTEDRIVSYFFWTHPDFTHALLPGATADVGEPLKAALEARPDIQSPLDRMLYLESRFFLADHNLAYTDKMSMATGLEVRVPLIDYEVVDYAATIPARLKQHGSAGKWIFKRAVERYLPAEVIERPKTGFGVPLRSWLKGPLRTLMNDLLSGASLRAVGLFDERAVARLMEKTTSGEVDGAYTLLALMCVTLWHQQFVAHAATQ